jgi:hypothetical protein
MKKGDFKINVDNSLFTISSQKQEEQKRAKVKNTLGRICLPGFHPFLYPAQ